MFVISIRPQPITTSLPILQHGKCAVIEWGIETQAANRICLFKELESFTKRKADVFAGTERIARTNLLIYSMSVDGADDLGGRPSGATNRPSLLRN